MPVPTFDVSIAAHYVPARIPYLAKVLEAIAGWRREQVTVTVVTNDLAIADEDLIGQAKRKLEAAGFALKFDRAHGMDHPWHLTWWHKRHLREWFDRSGTAQDLFMYIEDDIVVDADNIAYFERFLPGAKAAGCIPGFLRYEVLPDGTRMSPDSRGYQPVQDREKLTVDGQAFVAPQFSYWAGFVLDRELCAEYFASPWSDIDEADTLPQSRNHSCRVQSAWALTFENVPRGLPSRYVVPVDQELAPLPECMVWHSANNYTVSKTHNFGTVRMQDMLLEPGPLASLRQAHWDAQALARRLVDKVKRELGRS
ncbi:hypothetical protein [Alteraurantiacibacter aquimixticola]|uniref:Glycosyltransferase family 2 protein n=1 Tax=Alteraurantiacibacter aquimixticola TaxID=2489173 RepID=A0A4V4U888_9SPHN|nr:hypothetical protein [Alteraurantiacibacter aquimixticola]TIX48977.1 hypothetical protein E5222_14680 [Alteraurantiacibacter aquimixticola]